MISMILIGIPLPVSMLVCGFVGLTIVSGFNVTMTQFTNALYNLSHSYSFAVLPLFMAIGVLASTSGIAEGTFSAAKKWVGRYRGGLLYTIVFANMVFGACSGLASAGNIVFSKLSLPELRKSGYDENVSVGTIISAGTLSVLIPPSVSLVMFAILAEVAIGPVMIAGVSAGIVFALILCGVIFVRGRLWPDKIPATDYDRVPIKEKLKTLTLLFPIIGVFAFIVGGTFFGWFPPTMAGAVAVVIIILYAVFKRLPPKTIFACIMEAASNFASVFLIIVAGQFFSRFISVTGVTRFLINAITETNLAPYVVFLLVFGVYLICGSIMDALSALVITVPIVFPVLMGLGFNDLIIVLMLTFSMEIASLTPPIGIGVFLVSNATGIPVRKCFRSVVPFFILEIILVLVIVAVPELILWLPRLLGVTV
jgi:tripartite ATP-independent transporter DctM subunit